MFAWRPGLDGLRGVAIIAVMLVHFRTATYVPGGSFGVDLFFVLSGFLITTLLIQEWQSTGNISLLRFYARRALRLLPACFVFCAFFVGIIILFNDYRFTTSPGVDATLTSVGYALTYSLNWPVALGLAPPAGFGHLWSLSVEEQYYLLWPGVLLVMLRLGLTGRRMMLVTLVAVLLSAAMPFMLPELGWRRLQYGTDFRAQELLAGSLIAQLYVFNVVREAPLNRRPFKLLFGTAGLAFLAMVFMSNVRDDSMYRGGYTFLTITCAILVLGGAFSLSGPVSSLLGNRVLVYLGRRSYALYLWHMPIGIWLRHLEIEEQLVLAGLLSLAAAELSYRLVERPALRLKARLSPSTGFRSATSRRPAKVDAPATQAA